MKKNQVRSAGISMRELLESSRFGSNAREEFLRWFPSSPWIRPLHQDDALRERVLSRRAWLGGMTSSAAGVALGTGLVLPNSGCSVLASALPLIFEAIQAAQQIYTAASDVGGSALFTNSSQSRESAQLLTELMKGSDPGSGDLQDEAEHEVKVPGKDDGFLYAFDGLVSGLTGDHFLSGTAVGTNHISDIFDYGS